ncbi:MAG: UDP-N-acetylmuramate--L-alanine ligase [Actinomycetales bacterium]|nr:UDP-N-acetylmuramate--L-alanine ligase [Actinomycetales bacterium]
MSAWHLIGVGGAGMSVISALLAARGETVSGSDARASATVEALRERGVEVAVGHDAVHVEALPAGARVVVSTAVRESNPELAAARERGLDVLHRSEALAWLMRDRRVVAVAGAHGKTTTSAMLAVALTEAGLDPSFAIGGAVVGGPGALSGAGSGAGDLFVAEADESDGSFLAYSPYVALVTNVEPDHLDHFGSREAFEQVFADFAARVRDDGVLVACLDDDGARRLADRVRAEGRVRVVTYGTSDDADVVLDPSTGAVRFRAPLAAVPDTAVSDSAVPDGGPRLELSVPGTHNLLNASGALAVLALLGVSVPTAVAGLAAFRGTGRRFEERGSVAGVRVVDDYAHHPTEVTALLRAARTVAGTGRVLVLFQPHLFSRTAHFASEFATALSLADLAVVTDVYAAREDPVEGVTGETITRHMTPGVGLFVADRTEAALRVAAHARPGDLVLTVGAGDVTELAPVVLAALEDAP